MKYIFDLHLQVDRQGKSRIEMIDRADIKQDHMRSERIAKIEDGLIFILKAVTNKEKIRLKKKI